MTDEFARVQTNELVMASTSARVTEQYEGSLDIDQLINEIMTAHRPRLAEGNYQAAFWTYRDTVQVCEVLVDCSWTSESSKLSTLAFSLLPIAACPCDEIVWIADVALADIVKDPGDITSALLVVTYQEAGTSYPFAFPYTTADFGAPSYEQALFSGVTIPAGFVNTALTSMFVEDDEESESKIKAHGGEENKFLAAAMASAFGHLVKFPNVVPTLVGTPAQATTIDEASSDGTVPSHL